MVIEIVVGLVFWCPCGWHCRDVRGANQLIREHGWVCSHMHRLGQRPETMWTTGMTMRYGRGNRATKGW